MKYIWEKCVFLFGKQIEIGIGTFGTLPYLIRGCRTYFNLKCLNGHSMVGVGDGLRMTVK